MTTSAASLQNFFAQWPATSSWSPTEGQCQQMQNFYDLVRLANRSLNLTRILEPDAFWEKHLWDSLHPLLTQSPWTGEAIDLGTGGGFPGLPIAIAYPECRVTVVDATIKKINFIRSSLGTIPLSNVRALVDRAETIGRHPEHRHKYDLVTLRAVAQVTVCAEYSVPLLKIGGQALLYRGHWSDGETTALASAAQQLGARVAAVTQFVTPLTQGLRHCIYLEKVAPTPDAFPRAVGIPTQKPLG